MAENERIAFNSNKRTSEKFRGDARCYHQICKSMQKELISTRAACSESNEFNKKISISKNNCAI